MPDRIRLRDYQIQDGSIWMMDHERAYAEARERREAIDRMPTERAIEGRDRDVEPITMVGGVAVIDVVGVLSKSLSFMRMLGMSQQPTLVEILEAIDAAATDNQVMGILLRVNSPGGDVAGTFEVADAVWRARQAKPVHCYCEDLMASAAFAIGSQAQRITANQTGKVGGIGVFAVMQDMSVRAEEMGIKVHVIRSRRLKGAGTPGSELTDEQIAHYQQIVDDLDDVFVRTVQRGRLITRQAIDELDGGIYVGQRAARLGLIDEVGSVDDALAALAGRNSNNRASMAQRN